MQIKQLTLAEAAAATQSQLVGNPNHCITSVADLETAVETDASFLSNLRYEKAMHSSKAGVIFIDSKTALIEGRNFLINENPSRAFQALVEFFHGFKKELSGFKDIHPTAVIHETCQIGNAVTIGPNAVIDKEVVIGDNTFIGAGSYVGPWTTIGSDCILHPRATVREYCVIGNRVILQPGAVIGSCGYGYIPNKLGHHIKVSQVGNVVLEDDVEIGANTTIDRSRFKSTMIKKGTKIDNLVQIAHGVVIGEHNLIIAQTGIAGSTETGKHVIIAGQVAVNGHIKICDGAIISACTAVSKSIDQPGKYGGSPAIPLEEHNRNSVHLRKIQTYAKALKALKQQFEAHLKERFNSTL